MSETIIDEADIVDREGNVHHAVLYARNVIHRPVSDRTKNLTGTKQWEMARTGKHLNTDDDQTFEDLDGNSYRRVTE